MGGTCMSDTPETDAIRFSSNPREYYDLANRLERERDELRAEVAEWKNGTLRLACQHDKAALDTLAAVMAVAPEHAELIGLRATCERLDTELHLERFSMKELGAEVARLKAGKSRLEKALARIGFYFAGTDSDHVSKKIEAVLSGKSIDEAIDEAMK